MYHYLYYILLAITGIIFLNNVKSNKTTSFLVGYLTIILIYFLLHYAVFSHNSELLIAILIKHFYPFFYLPGALLYLYTRKSINKEISFKYKDLFHFLPFLLGVINIFPYYFIPFSEKLIFAATIIEHSDFTKVNEYQILFPYKTSSTIRLILFTVYLLLSIQALFNNWRININIRKTNQAKNLFKWLILANSTGFIFIICFFKLTSDFYFREIIDKTEINANIFTILAALTFFVFNVVLLFFPQVVYGIPISIYSKKKKINEENESIIVLAQRIKMYFENDEPYKNTTFSAEDLAEALGTQKHNVYRAFTQVLKTKFIDYRTHYRIEYTKKMLLDQNHVSSSLKEIWKNAGFSSKTNFFSTFKFETGLTPSEYIKINSEKDSL